MSFRSALAHRGFRSLWIGQLLSRIGDSVHEIALIWLVYEVTGDPTLLSLTFVASFLPTVLLSLPAGALVDRVNRKHVLVGSDLVRGGIVLVIPLLGPGPHLVPVVLSVAFLTGVLEAFFRPARTAIIPNLVSEDDLDSANSLTQITFSLSQILFALGGVVVMAVGSFTAFYVDAASFFLSAVFLLGIPSEDGVPESDETSSSDSDETTSSDADKTTSSDANSDGGAATSVLRELVEEVRTGLRFVRSHRLLQNLVLLLAALQLTIAPINVAAPVFATSLPFDGSLAVGFLYTALFTGVTLGSSLVSRYDEVIAQYRGRIIVVGLSSFGVFVALAAIVTPSTTVGAAVIMLSFAIAGVFFAAVRVPATTFAQVLVPDERLGRYTSVMNTVTSFGFVVGLGAAGPIIELVGARTTLLGVGSLALLLGVLMFFQPLSQAGGKTEQIEYSPSD